MVLPNKDFDLFQELQAKYEKEIERLNRKLKWYAQNQELLDKDTEIMKKKDDEIKQLKEKLDSVHTEVSVDNSDVYR